MVGGGGGGGPGWGAVIGELGNKAQNDHKWDRGWGLNIYNGKMRKE